MVLSFLVTATQQNNDLLAASLKVNPVTLSDMYPEFTDTSTNRFHVSVQSLGKSLHSRGD
ncbi:conserved hypothetical protein (plasmid) [Vibrio vulnificus YJ016]|uniref:Uncharacterized protein n=1 Tax=Vibrio vulnificus (strain YJ016) TaxID=196600 RepID=Q7MBK9_VIBVY|nr:conserved hypothetical protein [Vibrio vulnificus YJ016]